MTFENKTVALVVEWAKFEEKYKEGTLEDFCRHYLTAQREKKNTVQNFRGVVPPEDGAYLAKLIGRIYQILEIYIRIALKETDEVRSLHDFYFLNSIHHLGESRKTDIISYNFAELSSGIDILNRLFKAKLIQERVDPEDKRSRLVKTTSKGEKLLFKCYSYLLKTSDIVFWDMSQDDRKLCIQLLKGVEIKHSKFIHTVRNNTIQQIHETITGVRIKSK